MNDSIYNNIVEKPWGEEYCVYRENNISIWLLKINPNEKTSFHCHPNKKTGLILIDGIVQVNLIDRSFKLTGFEKAMFENGIFHQTHNISKKPIYLLEVETPDNKYDLIRIDDKYGRKNKNFETELKLKTFTNKIFKISESKKSRYKNITAEVITVENVMDNKKLKQDDLIIILGEYSFLNKNNEKLCNRGEVITVKIFKMFSQMFSMQKNQSVILLCTN